MKFNLLSLTAFVFVFMFFSCQHEKDEVLITGQIRGANPEDVYLALPVNGAYYLGFKQPVQLDSMGNFKVQTTIDKASFAGLLVYGAYNANFIIEPGETYEINLDLTGEEKSFTISCNSQKGQELCLTLPNPPHVQFETHRYRNLSSSAEIREMIEADRQKDIAAFNALYSQNEITKPFLDLIVTERTLFYAALQAETAKLIYWEEKREKNGVFTAGMKEMWRDAVLTLPVKDKDFLRSRWNTNFLESYLYYMENLEVSDDTNKPAVTRGQDSYHIHNLEISKRHLSGEVLEFYNAAYLYIECLQKKFEKELIALSDQFSRDFPRSQYAPFIQPLVEPIVEFHKRAELPFGENVRFIQNYENIHALNECLRELRGRRIYADIWTTSCGPCKDEFTHSGELKKYLDSQNIAILYISLDGESNHDLWQNMIRHYNLEGYHLRASKGVRSDLDSLLGSFGIPRYLFIDENGRIVNTNAKRPSQLGQLEKEINALAGV